ncbi:MAG: CTP synthase [Chloroflexia bacterium]
MEIALRIGLIGDYNPQVKAHIAIPKALQLASEAIGCRVEPVWLATRELDTVTERQLSLFDGLWCVPASPYESMDGALKGIRFAREHQVPFLGTCGGFQHALIEYARDVLGLLEADHAESNPEAATQLIAPLSCALVEAKGTINLLEGSRVRDIYGISQVEEEYRCSYGLNPEYRSILEKSEMRITGVDTEGDVRVVELQGHPFFLATLFQPERRALKGQPHPLINAYVQAAVDQKAVIKV